MNKSVRTNMNILKCVMAIFLFIALIDGLPYGYFMFLRLVVFFGSLALSWAVWKYDNRDKRVYYVVPLLLTALLFNPVFPVHLDRSTWAIIDAIVGISLAVWIGISLFLNRKTA